MLSTVYFQRYPGFSDSACFLASWWFLWRDVRTLLCATKIVSNKPGCSVVCMMSSKYVAPGTKAVVAAASK